MIPPPVFADEAHAGCLSLEFSSGLHNIIVNCGGPGRSRSHMRGFARATAAHSTLVIDDTSSARFAMHNGLGRWLGDMVLPGPLHVNTERQSADGWTTLRLSHDGYVRRFGYVHARDLFLADDGTSFEGRDWLEPSGKPPADAIPYAVRFHLHPSVRATKTEAGDAVVLDLPDGNRWIFQADAALDLEPSILFAANGGPRRTDQIVISSNTAARLEVHWAMRRRPPDGGDAGDVPE
jgi:uncharacterized heparinase superfamily protein